MTPGELCVFTFFVYSLFGAAVSSNLPSTLPKFIDHCDFHSRSITQPTSAIPHRPRNPKIATRILNPGFWLSEAWRMQGSTLRSCSPSW